MGCTDMHRSANGVVVRALFLVLVLIHPLPADGGARASKPPVFLKLNEYYVLYTRPLAPFVDESGRIIVPLHVTPEMMGLSVTQEPGGHLAVISRGSIRLELVAGRDIGEIWYPPESGRFPTRVKVNPPPMVHKPTWDMLVPVRVLSEVFGIKAEWKAERRTLEIRDDRAMKAAPKSPLELFEDKLRRPETEDTTDLIPVSFSFARVRDPHLHQFEMRLVLRDISRRGVPDGRQALYALVLYESGVSVIIGRDTFVSVDLGRTQDPCVKTSLRGFTCIEQFPFRYQDHVRYIIARTRLRK